MARALRAWAIKGRKNSVHNLPYGSRPRPIRGMYSTPFSLIAKKRDAVAAHDTGKQAAKQGDQIDIGKQAVTQGHQIDIDKQTVKQGDQIGIDKQAVKQGDQIS